MANLIKKKNIYSKNEENLPSCRNKTLSLIDLTIIQYSKVIKKMIKRKAKQKESIYNFYLYNWIFLLNNKHKWKIEVREETYSNNYPCEIVKAGRKFDFDTSKPIGDLYPSPCDLTHHLLHKLPSQPPKRSLWALSPLSHYLPEVACHFDIMPGVVIEFSIHWLHNGLKGPRPQVNDQGDCAILQSQVDVVSRLARVQDEPIPLPGLKGQGDFITAALDWVLRQVVAQVLWASESGHILLSSYRERKGESSQHLTGMSQVYANTKQNTHTHTHTHTHTGQCPCHRPHTSTTLPPTLPQDLYLSTRETSREGNCREIICPHRSRRLTRWWRKACYISFKFSQRKTWREISCKVVKWGLLAFASILAFKCL